MKKIFVRLFTTAIVAGMTAACNFLDPNPKTDLYGPVVYESEASLEAGIYGIMRGFTGDAMITGNMQEFLMDCSGLVHWGYATTTPFQDANEKWVCALNFTQYSLHNYNIGQYNGFYVAIRRANKMLQALPDSPVDEAFKAQVEGECKFYRALAYFYLVRMYGDVPLLLKTSDNLTEANHPRTAFWEVYAQIVKDRQDAESSMREYDEVGQISGHAAGRPCKWAATALLSNVYLTMGSLLSHPDDNFWDPDKREAKYGVRQPDFSAALGLDDASDLAAAADTAFAKALECADKVIEEGPYSLEPDYRKLFSWTDPSDYLSAERIFVITNNNQVSAGNYTAIRSLPQYPYGTQNFTSQNSNYGRFRPTRYVFQRWCGDNGGTKGAMAHNKNIFIRCEDPRFDATFIYYSYMRQYEGVLESVALYPNTEGSVLGVNRTNQPYFKKYLSPDYDANAGSADFYLMRLAELYYISAEAAGNLCQSKGDPYWNKAMARVESVHARARHSVDPGQPDANFPKWENNRFDAAADPVDSLLTDIFWDKTYELYGEGHEYWETHRMGATWLAEKIATPLNKFLRLHEQQYTSNAETDDRSRGYCAIQYGDRNFQYFTDPQLLRRSLLLGFPDKERIYNQDIPMDETNDFYWK